MLDLDTGYFIAESNIIKIPIKSIPEFPIRFNGFSFKLSVCYKIPYSL